MRAIGLAGIVPYWTGHPANPKR